MVNQLGEAEDGEFATLVIMADGMGGHAAGNVASNMVVATFNKIFQSKFPTTEIPEVLTEALNRSNDQIRASVKETPALRGMGCTMVTAYIQNNKLYWVSVGDSHLYLLRDRELIKQNADHSYGAYLDMMKEQGMEVEEQPGMSRNMLMSAMTGDEISSIDVPHQPVELRPGDRVIVASDGLDTLGAGAIIQYSSWSESAKECVYALLKAVEDANKINQDNTTLIVVDIKEREETIDITALPGADPMAFTVERAADIGLEDAWREPRSYKWLIWVVVAIVVVGGAIFAWQKGFVDEAVEKGAEIAESAQESLEAEREVLPAEETGVVTEAEPEAKPEPVPEPVKVTRYKPFRDRLRSGGRGPVMIKVPGGTFRMGARSGILSPDEVPRHEVRIKSFAVSVYEVTFEDYYRFATATKRRKPKNNGWDIKTHPVVDVSWDDAQAYVRWLSQQTGQKYRLLSESEWEYVARAGTTASYWWGSKAGVGNAHCFDCKSDYSTGKPARVGTYKPNPFGLYDTAGNVYK